MGDAQKWFLYAITGAGHKLPLASLPAVATGDSTPCPPRIISNGLLAAVASPFKGERVRPERRNLSAHHAVLRRLTDAGVDFLPAAFGMLASSRPAIIEMLRANREPLLADLRRLSGKVEMGLKVVWDVPNIFEFMASRCQELVQLRDRLLRKSGAPTRDDKIELGRTFELLLNEARERHVATVTGALGDCLRDFKVNAPRDEKSVMNLACLVPRGDEKPFEQGVFRAAKLFDDNYAFDYNGPWPPFNFVTASLAVPETRAVVGKD